MDGFDQKYFIYQKLYSEFQNSDNFNALIKENVGIWTKVSELANWLNGLAEEQINPKDLLNDCNPAIVDLGNAKIKYDELINIKID